MRLAFILSMHFLLLPTEFSPHNHSSPMSGEVLRSDGEVSCWENWENWEAQ